MKLKLVTAFFYFFLVLSFTIQSQTSKKTDSISQKSFDELTNLYYQSKSDTLKAILYANAYFEKALKEKDTMEMFNGKEYLAYIKKDKNIFLDYCDYLINVNKKYSSKISIVKLHLYKIDFYFRLEENSNILTELLIANKILKENKNDSLQSVLYYYTGYLKQKVKKHKEAIKYYKKAYAFIHKNKHLKNSRLRLNLDMPLAFNYIKCGEMDSANFYNKKAIVLMEKLAPELLNYAYYNEGVINITQKKYRKAIQSFKNTLPALIEDKNLKLMIGTYSKIGITYDSLNNPNESKTYHLKADSLYQKEKIKRADLSASYKFLLKDAKENNNLKDQLSYTEKLLEIKEFNLNEKNKVTTTFINEYDIPKLNKEKEVLQLKIKNEKYYKIIFCSVIVIFLILLVYQIRKKKFYRKQFEKIIHKKEEVIVNRPKEIIKKSTSQISDEIVNAILEKLILFEKNKDFLKPDINLSNLANTLDTNSNYLSKIVNQHKNISFSNYINELRINYVIEQLKTDKVLRKYTIKAIANDVGYKNVESFSKAFYKYTQLKPSYFIKELEKAN